jgi:hypothetical protein
MDSPSKLRTECEAQRCLIEEQQHQIQRLKHRVEMLFRYTVQVHAELDALRTTAEATASTPTFNPTKRHRNNNNGNGHRAASHFMGETDSSSSEQLGIAAAGGRARLNGKGRSRTI